METIVDSDLDSTYSWLRSRKKHVLWNREGKSIEIRSEVVDPDIFQNIVGIFNILINMFIVAEFRDFWF